MSESYGSLDAAYAAVRWGWYLAAFLVLGAGSYAPFLFRPRTGVPHADSALAASVPGRAARLGLGAALLLLLFTGLRLHLQARTLIDPGEPVTADLIGAILGSDWGHGWLRQLAMALVALLALGGARAGWRAGWVAAAAAGCGLAVVAGMTGHAAAGKAGRLGPILDAAHLWAGGLWLGGLAVLAIAGLGAVRGLPEEEHAGALRGLVADFSRRALVVAPLAVAFGAWLAVKYLGWSWPLQLAGSGYGRVLLVKLGLLVVVGGLGAWNWRVIQPRLAETGGSARFRRTSTAELLFGAFLLAATAVLVALPMPGDAM